MARPDRALRRQVALLQELDESDRIGVLELLGEAERDAVLTLLAGGTIAPAQEQIPPADALVLPQGLSPWLRERLGQADGASAESFAVTQHSLEQLRACVAELVPQPPRQRAWHAPLTGWLARLRGPAEAA